MSKDSKDSKSPPRLATRFLRWYCRSELLDEIEGDLYELFQRRVEAKGLRRAQLRYWLNVLMFFHPDYIRKRKQYNSINHTAMFRSYLKVTARNAVKHKFYATINVLGLAIGMTCCLLIFLYVNHELSYDNFHSKADRTYRVVVDIKTPTEIIYEKGTSSPMAAYMKTDFPEVENMVRIDDAAFLLQTDDKTFEEDEAMLVDSTFFDVFSFTLLQGNPKTALKEPFSIVLTEKGAQKYFGNEDPLGQQLLIEQEYNCTVTGVMRDIPKNSSFDAQVFLSLSSELEELNPTRSEQWGNFGYTSYVQLSEGADPKVLESKLPNFLSKYISEDNLNNGMNYTLFLEPLSKVYFSDRGGFIIGSLTNVRIFSAIAVFILLIACINFMNLATSRATERAKEVGIRKVAGAVRRQLTTQFLLESVLLSLTAFAIALLLGEVLLPTFNQLAGKTVADSVFQETYYLPIFTVFTLMIGLLAGIYPALVLSGFGSATILKGRFSSSQRGIVLRKVLVVAQFAISIVLIAGTMVVYAQLDFMKSQSLGFKKDQMLVIDFRGDPAVQKNIEAIKQQLSGHPSVQSLSTSSSVPGRANNHAFTEIENPDGDMQATNVNQFYVDHNFLSHYEIELTAGRYFSPEFATDSSTLIINEALAKSCGYAKSEDIIGKRFSQWGVEGEIVGVVQDYHFRSLQENVKPMTIRWVPYVSQYISLNLRSENLSATVSELEQQWQDLAPQRPFNYFFLDEAFDRQYRAEVRFGQLFVYFAGLAIFIACLGLLGLISYTIVQRTKEIGIRKVLGATESSIVRLLSKDFLVLVLIAFIIATPIAWYVLQQWLADFAYRTPMPWWVFALAGLTATFVAMLTVSFQSIKAALANPVDSLRNE
ncbi:ABC transporter permease [Tunicatimonas pelagia]|uniref:ABC transporter permease n=1 Tax=Tunicatimonas pelagia TaxID=931531 RepID=UPI002665BF49|nr:ABC transporter permease [Tunicatimonas pelagia]WKN41479.1 ABC transporter permease [Tunicatimonas pelagia]